mmetsp:Transcript_33718/g.60540  ORF Transcript_33718/g.60540 Transcript_33718/m.60540 type:complete len:240 (-) Transcript_33718:504-1223(-)
MTTQPAKKRLAASREAARRQKWRLRQSAVACAKARWMRQAPSAAAPRRRDAAAEARTSRQPKRLRRSDADAISAAAAVKARCQASRMKARSVRAAVPAACRRRQPLKQRATSKRLDSPTSTIQAASINFRARRRLRSTPAASRQDRRQRRRNSSRATSTAARQSRTPKMAKASSSAFKTATAVRHAESAPPCSSAAAPEPRSQKREARQAQPQGRIASRSCRSEALFCTSRAARHRPCS